MGQLNMEPPGVEVSSPTDKMADRAGVDASPANLSFGELLHLLRKKAVLGRGIPAKYDTPPWRLPATHASSNLVNSLLNHSMAVQAANIPGSGEFQDFILSNSSLAVAGLLRHYLSLLGLQADIVFGVLLWEEAARAGEDDFEGTPHVWLRIDNNPIDNTHVAFPADGDNLEYFFECKRLNSYLAEDPLKTKKRLFLGQDTGEEGAGTETVHHNLKVLQTYSFPAHIDKYLAVALHHAELNPSLKLYHLLMMDWVKARLEEVPKDLEAGLSVACWACKKEADQDTLKTCTDCKVARYCDRDCQRMEWKVHKLLHRELHLTKKILEENEKEANVETETDQ